MDITPVQKEYNRLLRQEKRRMRRYYREREGILNKMLSDKVPEKLQNTLDKAFYKAFKLIFTKGTSTIEHTYNRKKMEQEYQIRDFAGKIKNDRKSIRAFNKTAKTQDNVNLLASGISGVGLGFLGIGIPDIPLFTAMMLRDIYATALNYGYTYDTKEERYFILLLIQASISYGAELYETDMKINMYIENGELPQNYEEDEQIRKTAGALSQALLYMKFLQGIPLVGAVGGFYDAIYMRSVAVYSTMKYKRRYLFSKLVKKSENSAPKKLLSAPQNPSSLENAEECEIEVVAEEISE